MNNWVILFIICFVVLCYSAYNLGIIMAQLEHIIKLLEGTDEEER